jgi:hypothetical protein
MGLAWLGNAELARPSLVSIPCGRSCRKLHMLQYTVFETTDANLVGRTCCITGMERPRASYPLWVGRTQFLARKGFRRQGRQAGCGNGNRLGRRAKGGGQLRALPHGCSERSYDNPRPDTEITSIDFQSTMTPCSPVLVAITLE